MSFPNPQDALPLPVRPNLERYRKLAKELTKASKSSDENAVRRWAAHWIRALGKSHKVFASVRDVATFAASSGKCTLTQAQFVIARCHGFESWTKFAKHLQALAAGSDVSRFEAAADAIVNGDVATVSRLLKEDPKLIKATSLREHGSTLLHYVSANGVESYRQKTPGNIVAITELLLNAGAEVDATSNVYGGECTTLGLAATSVHPENAGVQEALMQVLLDHGARMDGPALAGRTHSIVIACLANGRPRAAEFLAARRAHLDLASAIALGRLDVVRGFFNESGSLKPNASRTQMNEGFGYACAYGRREVVRFLLEKDVDLATQVGGGQTALHEAVISGDVETVKLLLKYKPPLEVKNMYGGTVFGQALWSAAHGGDPDSYIAILEVLSNAGAKLPERHIAVNSRLDAWLAARGSIVEPSWYWFGEEPNREE